MEDLECIFGQACRELERNDWIAEVKRPKEQHEDECAEQGVKLNKN
jgi:hypothetical protein